jgi:alpha-amylase
VPRRHASPTTRLVFVLHFHQAFGNFPAVFENATDRCYSPTLDLLAQNPHVCAGIHVSGTLLQWLARSRPAVLDTLRELAQRDQIEILGGGLEEPVLAMLTERDAIGQLTRMADLCEEMLGRRPRGMWLAERVWEPDLPRVIAGAGYRYTLLDDTHIFAAGVAHRPQGYYVTEKAGSAIAVFPIDRELRMRIPFATIDALLHYLYGARGEVLTYGDDVEKFGLWPTTARRVWNERWLESLFAAFKEQAEWLSTAKPSEILSGEPSGLVYPPTMAYPEMSAWSLPAEMASRYVSVVSEIDKAGLQFEAEPFVRGGTWPGFLAKYPESRRMYRKMLRVSQLVEDARVRGDDAYDAARAALYRGQASCAYWHGLFGGLYVAHLRSAISSALLEAETLLLPSAAPSITTAEHDTEFFEEVLLEAGHLNLALQPSRGGTVTAIELRDPRFLLTDVLGQRFEAYHLDVPDARVVADEDLETMSVHDIVRAAVPNLVDKLKVDVYDRGAFIDHLLPAGADLRALTSGIYAPLVNLPATPYAVELTETAEDMAVVVLRGERDGVVVRKDILIDNAGVIDVRYDVTADGPLSQVAFASEIGLTLLGPDAADGRRIEIVAEGGGDHDPAPGATGSVLGVRGVKVIGEALGVHVELEVDPPAELWRFPLETVSRSERGFDVGYQGTVLAFVWRGSIGEGSIFQPSIRCDVSRCRRV